MLDAFFEAIEHVEKKREAGHYEPAPTEQRRVRIRLALAAYAYEFYDDSIISDAEFDSLSLKVDSKMKTGDDELDQFFEKHFDSSTGMWIHKHPGLDRLEVIYDNYFKNRKRD